MRLTPTEILAIRETAQQVFGKSVEVFLFGSRLDDQKKGGDIDLLIKINDEDQRAEIYAHKLQFLVNLKDRIGDQKIDVMINSHPNPNPMIREILYKAKKLT